MTNKGISHEGIKVQWGLMWPFATIGALTLFGVAVNASPSRPLIGADGYALNVFWSVFNMAVLGLVILACIALPRRGTEERFASGERGVVIWPGRAGAECRVLDISLGGARLAAGTWDDDHEHGSLWLDGGPVEVPFARLRRRGQELVVRFSLTQEHRRALIRRLFDRGDYTSELEHVSIVRVIGTLFSRLLG